MCLCVKGPGIAFNSPDSKGLTVYKSLFKELACILSGFLGSNSSYKQVFISVVVSSLVQFS